MKTQTNCERREAALRRYEAAHKVWMNTRVSTPEGEAAKKTKDEARREYEACLESPEGLNVATHPDNPVSVRPHWHCVECGGEHEPSGAREDCILYWKGTALKNRELVEQSVALLCSASPNSKLLDEGKQREWAEAFGKFFAEAMDKHPRLNDWGVAHMLCSWLNDGKYRSLQHRHDGTYRAVDQALSLEWNADTQGILTDLLINLPPRLAEKQSNP